jgi:hypothetical protein
MAAHQHVGASHAQRPRGIADPPGTPVFGQRRKRLDTAIAKLLLAGWIARKQPDGSWLVCRAAWLREAGGIDAPEALNNVPSVREGADDVRAIAARAWTE